MKIILILFLLFSLISIITSELIGLIDIFRHGARSPVTVDSKGKDIINQVWVSKAQLTNIGIRQQFIAGQELRKRYYDKLKLLSGEVNEIKLYSTNTNRTILSAYSRVIGILNNSKAVFPVKILDFPVESPDLKSCITKDKENINNNTQSNINKYVRRYEKTIHPLLKYKLNLLIETNKKRILPFTPSSKEKKILPKSLYHIAEAIYCSQTDKRNLSYLELTRENITFFEEYRHYYLYNGKRGINESISLIAPYMKVAIGKIEKLLTKEKSYKYIGYSVHDTTLVNLFIFMETAKLIPPKNYNFPFASQLIIEVYNNRSLNFIYNDIKILSINFNEIKHIFEDIDFKNRREVICLKNQQGIWVFKETHNFFLYFAALDCILFIVLLLIFFFYKGKETDENKNLIKDKIERQSQEIKLIKTNSNSGR